MALKRMMFFLIVAACLTMAPIGADAYTVTINDPAGDQIGVSGFDTTKIVYNVNEIPLVVTITTNYPEAGIKAGDWQTYAADLILTGAESSPPSYAIVLVDHDGFTAGTLYAIGSMYKSDDFAPSADYIWGYGEDVWLKTGTSTGYTGTVTWTATGLTYTANGWGWTDTNPEGDYLDISWATSTCANDVVRAAAVPEPASLLLFGLGLLGLAGIRRTMKK